MNWGSPKPIGFRRVPEGGRSKAERPGEEESFSVTSGPRPRHLRVNSMSPRKGQSRISSSGPAIRWTKNPKWSPPEGPFVMLHLTQALYPNWGAVKKSSEYKGPPAWRMVSNRDPKGLILQTCTPLCPNWLRGGVDLEAAEERVKCRKPCSSVITLSKRSLMVASAWQRGGRFCVCWSLLIFSPRSCRWWGIRLSRCAVISFRLGRSSQPMEAYRHATVTFGHIRACRSASGAIAIWSGQWGQFWRHWWFWGHSLRGIVSGHPRGQWICRLSIRCSNDGSGKRSPVNEEK